MKRPGIEVARICASHEVDTLIEWIDYLESKLIGILMPPFNDCASIHNCRCVISNDIITTIRDADTCENCSKRSGKEI